MRPALVLSVALALAVPILGAAVLWWPTQSEWQAVFRAIEDLGPWLAVALVAAMVLHNFVPVPAELIAVTAGATLGLVPGVAVVWLGAMLGAALAFWLARRFGRGLLQGPRTSVHLARFDRMVAAGDWRGLLVVRLIPVVSFNLVNYAAGLTCIGWRRFLWTTALGIVPVTVLAVAAGCGLQLIGAGPALGLAAAIALVWIAVRAGQRLRY